QACTLAGDHVAALAAAAHAEGPLWPTASWFEHVEYAFDAALAGVAACDAAEGPERATRRAAVARHRRRLAQLTQRSPDNLGNRLALVDAEIARLEGRELEAERLYERSMRLAREGGFVQIEAIAGELAARFHLARGFETIADAYLAGARAAYLRWGALGKVR